MTTADELLAGAMTEVEQVLTINWETRTIDIPKTISNLGVESDDEVKHLKFSAPRYYHGTDLSTFKVRINYLNANQEGDMYEPKDVTVTTDSIEFTWIVGRFATMYKGDVEFNVCMVILDAEGVIDKEVNTTPSILPVLKGLETVPALMEEERDAMTAAVLDALERAQSTDLKGEPGYTPVKGEDYYTEEERNEFRDSIVFDANGQFANALRGTAKGEVIRVDDVCPVPHMTRVKIGGKNLFSLNYREVSDFGDFTCQTLRELTGYGIYVGVSSSNYYDSTNASYTYDEATNQIEVTSKAAWYGLGIDIPVKPNTKYTMSGIVSEGGSVGVSQYTEYGEHITGGSGALGSFTTSADAAWVVVSLVGTSNGGVCTFTNMQLEEGSVATEYEPFINPSDVTLFRCGKNLFNLDKYELTYPDRITRNWDDSFTITSNVEGNSFANFSIAIPENIEGQSITVSGRWKASGQNKGALRVQWYDKDKGGYVNPVIALASVSGTSSTGIVPPRPSNNSELRLLIYFNTDGTLAIGDTITYRDVQVEIGDTATEYESYSGASFYPSGSGRVDFTPENFGIITPTMTLTTDTPGVMIEVEYSKDINCLHAAEVEKEIEELKKKVNSIPTAVLYTPQTPTPAQQAQARENIGAISGYYSTAREEPGFERFMDIDSANIFGLYDALVSKYPDKIKKNEITNNDGTFTNYEYVISSGDYTTDGYYCELGEPNLNIKKPKYLLSSGIHGNESVATLYLYRFVRDVLEGRNVPNAFRESTILHVIPVINPWGLDNATRSNENNVDINRNFNWKWDENTSEYKGTKAESEKETQVVVNWLNSHTDADLWIDLHNSAMMHELVAVLGSDRIDTAKKIAMRGIDKVIPFWKEVIGYPKSIIGYEYVHDEDGNYVLDENGEYLIEYVPKELVYSYSAIRQVPGTGSTYVSNILRLPAIVLEIAAYNGDYLDWITDKPISTENVSMGAEILGNILVEFYEESFVNEVVDVTETNEKIDAMAESTNSKLDAIMRSVNSGFRVETGVYTVAEDLSGSQKIIVPGTVGAKIMVFEPNEATKEALLGTTGSSWVFAVVVQVVTELPYSRIDYLGYGSYLIMMNKDGGTGAIINKSTEASINADGLGFKCAGIKAGTYNWTAYYWND